MGRPVRTEAQFLDRSVAPVNGETADIVERKCHGWVATVRGRVDGQLHRRFGRGAVVNDCPTHVIDQMLPRFDSIRAIRTTSSSQRHIALHVLARPVVEGNVVVVGRERRIVEDTCHVRDRSDIQERNIAIELRSIRKRVRHVSHSRRVPVINPDRGVTGTVEDMGHVAEFGHIPIPNVAIKG